MIPVRSSSPLVSVIVPSYCHEEFIFDCLRSIHAQTYANIELVMIDDCSSDSTFEHAKAVLETNFSQRFQNVILERNDVNMGAHATINRGISLSSGEYVAIINSDDMFRPTRIERILDDMREAGSGLGFSLANVIGNPSNSVGEPDFPHQFLLYPLRLAFGIQRDPTVGFALMRENFAISTGNLVFARSLYDKVGPFLSLKYCHDWDFVLQSLFYTEPVPVQEALYDYRLHGQNSFSGLAHVAGMETEVVLRRFLRRGLTGLSPNPLFPCERNWPGFFNMFAHTIGMGNYLDREAGKGNKNWRIYEGH